MAPSLFLSDLLCAMNISGLLRRRRKTRTNPTPTIPTSFSDPPPTSGRNFLEEIEPPLINGSITVRTASNALQAILALGSSAGDIQLRKALASTIDPLLERAVGIRQTASNEQDLGELATRIKRLTSMVSEMARDTTNLEQTNVETAQGELESIIRKLEVACLQGDFEPLFDPTDNAYLEKHNLSLALLTQIYQTVRKVDQSVRKLEIDRNSLTAANMEGSSPSQVQIVRRDITGEVGDAGTPGLIGGEGGYGAGPILDLDPEAPSEIGNISGGTGGPGGVGGDVGGKGGAGGGPVIRGLRRTRP
ncbi:hypothetical protein MVEN_01668000 [Mycena venus]|uniref:Uncharacterized protein n=1 Tax=Mycena venus TaxID=2733690 RepID=A0A8H6XRB4_9AGAR|nr:hypothetical protein MVEN_01668000 [Mycena venus]